MLVLHVAIHSKVAAEPNRMLFAQDLFHFSTVVTKSEFHSRHQYIVRKKSSIWKSSKCPKYKSWSTTDRSIRGIAMRSVKERPSGVNKRFPRWAEKAGNLHFLLLFSLHGSIKITGPKYLRIFWISSSRHMGSGFNIRSSDFWDGTEGQNVGKLHAFYTSTVDIASSQRSEYKKLPKQSVRDHFSGYHFTVGFLTNLLVKL